MKTKQRKRLTTLEWLKLIEETKDNIKWLEWVTFESSYKNNYINVLHHLVEFNRIMTPKKKV